ncbi:MAG TPA: hypothetical protein VFK94_01105 [Patescibacteria group bacterium]|nr:hypothetical protein [Patescibacteria group bacterium]
MAEYIEERQTTEDRSFMNPFAIIVVLLLLAALAWYVFAAPRGDTTNNTTNTNQPTNVTTPTDTTPSTTSGTP